MVGLLSDEIPVIGLAVYCPATFGGLAVDPDWRRLGPSFDWGHSA